MKNISSVLIALMLVVVTNVSFAQAKLKFGHIDSNELIASMPERDGAQKQLQAYANELEKQLTTMQQELESKYSTYLQQEGTLNDVVKEAKQTELQDLQARIQKFQQNAQEKYQKKEGELLQPIIDRANDAIQVVGKENAFTYIFDVGVGAVVYFSPDSEDILPLVKAKLGITAEAKKPVE
ncbi:MAG: OmpH family outer membrane protein [Bacteroidales bacterium]|nr:OmpH family outer membrane protein [Bacteroidales bacterium]MCF8454408.1 OmpH family outer membrane protein [Bacteroidales bacterium]